MSSAGDWQFKDPGWIPDMGYEILEPQRDREYYPTGNVLSEPFHFTQSETEIKKADRLESQLSQK